MKPHTFVSSLWHSHRNLLNYKHSNLFLPNFINPLENRTMSMRMHPVAGRWLSILLVCGLSIIPWHLMAQDRLKSMPGFEQYEKMRVLIPGSVKMGTLSVNWAADGRSFSFEKDGKNLYYDLVDRKLTDVQPKTKETAGPSDKANNDHITKDQPDKKLTPTTTNADRTRSRSTSTAPTPTTTRPAGRQNNERSRVVPGGPERGRQFASAPSPDGKYRAYHKDRNLWISSSDGQDNIQVTSDGDDAKRIKNGIASWVYGEELFQNTAMWWSPNSKMLAFYRFDESKVPDFYLQLNQTSYRSKMGIEPYPKVGDPNPIVELLVYHIDDKQLTKIDVRDGKPFTDDSIGHYVYRVSWSHDSKQLLFHRTNRLQKIMEFVSADPHSGQCRCLIREEWQPSWVENFLPIRYLQDNHRFIWQSERNGFKNYYLYNLDGKLLATLTKHESDVANIVRVDENQGVMYYMARTGDNHMKLQLHRVGLDGQGDLRLTDPKYHHAVQLSPDGKYFIDNYQDHKTPPCSRLVDMHGKVLEELKQSDTSKFDELGLQRVEMFTFKAADGQTELHGMLHKPSKFDPKKKYPVIVSVYAGPATNGARETFTMPSPITEYGFLYVTLDARSAGGRGKKFLDAIYRKLGITEIDDLAAGVKALGQREYVDTKRVGIYGTSYGGYASLMCILRYPDLFHAACANSAVTDFRQYDTIYTERYMGLPDENKAGYDAGSAMKYAGNLKGRLMIYYGTADDNVHPNNSMQLIRALQRARKSFEVQVGPDLGHTAVSQDRMMEFFIENLVMRP